MLEPELNLCMQIKTYTTLLPPNNSAMEIRVLGNSACIAMEIHINYI
jgi:hypothetical protein